MWGLGDIRVCGDVGHRTSSMDGHSYSTGAAPEVHTAQACCGTGSVTSLAMFAAEAEFECALVLTRSCRKELFDKLHLL